MNWVNILWPMIAATCLTLAGMHVLVWINSRQSWANLAFSYFRTGRFWLAHAAWMARLASLIINFTIHPNLI